MKDVDPSIVITLKRKIPRIRRCQLNARKRDEIMFSFNRIIHFDSILPFILTVYYLSLYHLILL